MVCIELSYLTGSIIFILFKSRLTTDLRSSLVIGQQGSRAISLYGSAITTNTGNEETYFLTFMVKIGQVTNSGLSKTSPSI